MDKLQVTLFAFLLLVVSSYAVRTITVQIDEDLEQRGRQCRRQIQQAELRSCARYLTRGMHQMLMMMGSNNENPEHESEERLLNECCNQMRRLDRECQCEALQEIRQRESEMGSEQSQRVDSRLRKIVSRCDVEESCQE